MAQIGEWRHPDRMDPFSTPVAVEVHDIDFTNRALTLVLWADAHESTTGIQNRDHRCNATVCDGNGGPRRGSR